MDIRMDPRLRIQILNTGSISGPTRFPTAHHYSSDWKPFSPCNSVISHFRSHLHYHLFFFFFFFFNGKSNIPSSFPFRQFLFSHPSKVPPAFSFFLFFFACSLFPLSVSLRGQSSLRFRFELWRGIHDR
ncbi:hypothetical protein P175DRAFT_0337570 [Aspergillus ochraceoroseus IBT 24754]|uniref:Uncharacterized protein n=1 Tax=Aspergillus ochraceoroseus IBT 24754 TaxID=1392256 RepID=A0A2T5LRI4_9EURO|nr:uncharacterized protein P175DRAFT_0337570 [Aspergillus ochraceoroseus IBT 24754]PTU18887.1 hypothetical protein P175DRAFT_0337570 [Aspergillus ochraceoroseus IBT 24754]